MSLLDNIGIGIDIQDIASFGDYATPDNARFLSRVFTEDERYYCLGMASPPQHLAARFAAKEAVVKALSPFTSVAIEQVEVTRHGSGRPAVTLLTPESLDYDIRVSLSHSPSQAVAVAVVERRSDDR
jgi:phosphopantetheine--protein transferase-like protein